MTTRATPRRKPAGTVRLSDIAAHVGVSRTTVASVLLKSAGKNARVGPETEKKIRAAAKKLGYCPNVAAQRLAGKQSKLIGVLIDSYAPVPRFRQLSELERAADERGYRIMIGQSHGELFKITAYADDFIANGVAGVVCISHDYPDIGREVAKAFLRLPSVVFLGRPLIDGDGTNWVGPDHAAATQSLTEHILSTGRIYPLLCLTDLRYLTSQDRQRGFQDALSAHGIADGSERTVLWDRPDWNWSSPALHGPLTDALREVLAKQPVDSILASNDLVALQIIRSLRTLGLRVPDDVAVAGYDNLQMTDLITPSLTTVDLQDAELARRAFDLLLALIKNKPPAQRQHQIPGQVVVRESTTAMPPVRP